MNLASLLLVLWAFYSSCEPARILSVIPTQTKSHYAAARKILLELASRGHDVVSISPYEEKDAPPNFKWVPVEVSPTFFTSLKHDKITSFFAAQRFLWNFIPSLYSEEVINHSQKLTQFIREDKSHFDLVICEEFFQPMFYVFSYKYNAPLVLISSFGPAHYINEYMGNSLELAYVPHEFVNIYGDMSLYDRARNLIDTLYDLIGRKLVVIPRQNELAQRLFPDLKDVPSVEDLERDASLLLLNSHFSVTSVRPYLPNMIEIAGVHLEQPKPLEQNFQKLLDEATEGAILFSFGSVMDLSMKSEDIVRPILKALGRMKQKVLIKWNPEKQLPLQFENIHHFKWLPQFDILAHPNLRAFITHGGLHSTLEAVHHGVPVVCVPFFGDQHINCLKSVKMGYGRHIDTENLTEENLYTSMQEILENSAYRNVARELSFRFKDRPKSAMDNAMFWIEYVMRHKGAEFLKGPKRNMYWYQYLFVDVLAIIVISVWVVVKILKSLYKLVFNNKVGKVKKS